MLPLRLYDKLLPEHAGKGISHTCIYVYSLRQSSLQAGKPFQVMTSRFRLELLHNGVCTASFVKAGVGRCAIFVFNINRISYIVSHWDKNHTREQ